MKKNLALITLLVSLSGCSFVHKMNIEQGNSFTPEMVQRLHPGMSEDQVREIMGTPMLTNTFDNNRLDYVYTYQPGHKPMTEKRVTLYFKNHILKNIQVN